MASMMGMMPGMMNSASMMGAYSMGGMNSLMMQQCMNSMAQMGQFPMPVQNSFQNFYPDDASIHISKLFPNAVLMMKYFIILTFIISSGIFANDRNGPHAKK